jgi:hypothetical protein
MLLADAPKKFSRKNLNPKSEKNALLENESKKARETIACPVFVGCRRGSGLWVFRIGAFGGLQTRQIRREADHD